MINLLPPATKSAIVYSRRNLRLLHWTIGSLAIIVSMGATAIVGGYYIDNAKVSLTKSIDQTKMSITTQKLDKVQTKAEELSGGVKLIVKVLSKEVRFSKLLQQIGTLMPTGATLGNIQLSNKINGAIDITANALDYQTATQVQVNLQDPKNTLFEKVDTISVSCNEGTITASGTSSRYKCQIIARALFKKDAAVTYLTTPAAKTTGVSN